MPATRSSSSSPHLMTERKDDRSPPLPGDNPQYNNSGRPHDEVPKPYEEIMGMSIDDNRSGISSLSLRLETFRKWLTDDAKIIAHPALCVVNGEATDGTKHAPVMVYEAPPTSHSAPTNNSTTAGTNGEVGRIGFIDTDSVRALYDRTMGCQIRTTKEIKKDEVVLTVPISAMITPDLVAASDAGRAIQACCQRSMNGADEHNGRGNFWDVFDNTAVCEANCANKISRDQGTQLLVKILQERKRVETAFHKAMQDLKISGNTDLGKSLNDGSSRKRPYNLAAPGLVSTRAPFLAFLIHQRFSNQLSPPVVSDGGDNDDSVLSSTNTAYRIQLSSDTPSTFAPYARTLPSFVSLPICWKRNELALLAGCIPGMSPLQQAAARTIQLATEFSALLEAGILFRFPRTFPIGLITWERWVWAASVFTSRTLPASCCLREGENRVSLLSAGRLLEFQSTPDVWDELGILVPLLDMLNHESDANQITWQQYQIKSDSGSYLDEPFESSGRHPRAVLHSRVKKGAQLYTCYGNLSNQDLILQYGFAQMNNSSDQLGLGWSLADAVGNVQTPNEYTPPFDGVELTREAASQVFESIDSDAIDAWWSDDRLFLLKKEAAQAASDSFMTDLKDGKKKMTCTAYSCGTIDPILLAAAVVATIAPSDLSMHVNSMKDATDESVEKDKGLTLTRSHQRVLRSYLVFIFSRKLEKLLQNLNNGLKDHFSKLSLWTRVSQGGLKYKGGEPNNMDDPVYMGWQAFFDSLAYNSTIEVEKRYYSMSPVSCVLTLYDGHLKTLQVTLDGLSTWEKYENGVLSQLQDIGYVILKEESATTENITVVDLTDITTETAVNGSSDLDPKLKQSNKEDGKQKKNDGKGTPSKGRRRNRKKPADRPPALKLHVGNLAYTTTPSDLYDYFAHLYGRENVLECHIPTERGTGRSRGFGFVTMPEAVARRATQSGRNHEIHGRLLKVAESNSVGTGKTAKGVAPPPPNSSTDRCMNCGYSPKYCVCPKPQVPGFIGPPGVPSRMDRYDRRDAYERDFYHYGPGGGRSYNDRYSGSHSPPRRGSGRSDRERDNRRNMDRDHRNRSSSRSDSGSRERGRDRDRNRSERRRRDRSDSRSPPHRSHSGAPSSKNWEHRHSRGSSRHSRSRSDSRDRSNSRSYSDRRERRANLEESLVDSGRGGTKRSPNADQSYGTDQPTSSRKREHRKRSRSRSRGKSSRKRSRKDSKKHTRSPSDSDSYSERSDDA